ncbi:hypothetical protein BLOT_012176 [Blomia tropicalis]|nr:hypothetical protein BLOT_012176 [Blomia tropicalis]
MDAVKVYQNGGMINRPNLTINELTLFEDYSLLETLDYWPHQVILIGLYTTIAIFSFILNLITIVVLVRCEKICSELYVYLINLSLSDIVMSLLCIPYTYTSFILNRWIFPHFLCPVVNFAQVCSVFVSIWTLAIIGIDRYFAIINPLGGETKWMILNFGPIKHRKKLFIMMTIWLVGILSGSVQFFYTRVVPFPYGSKTLYDCRENLPKRYAKVYTIYLFVGTFGFPLLILVYVYSIIGYHVWRHVAPGNPHHSRDHNNSLTREKVIKILILIVVLFFCLWAPLQIFTLIVEFNERFLQVGSPNDYRLFVYSYLVSHVLAMAHSLVNPIAYCFISHNFWVSIIRNNYYIV